MNSNTVKLLAKKLYALLRGQDDSKAISLEEVENAILEEMNVKIGDKTTAQD